MSTHTLPHLPRASQGPEGSWSWTTHKSVSSSEFQTNVIGADSDPPGPIIVPSGSSETGRCPVGVTIFFILRRKHANLVFPCPGSPGRVEACASTAPPGLRGSSTPGPRGREYVDTKKKHAVRERETAAVGLDASGIPVLFPCSHARFSRMRPRYRPRCDF